MGRWIFPPKQFWIPNPKKNIRTKKQNQYTKGHIPVLLKKKKKLIKENVFRITLIVSKHSLSQ